jgi:hypothetical protein
MHLLIEGIAASLIFCLNPLLKVASCYYTLMTSLSIMLSLSDDYRDFV